VLWARSCPVPVACRPGIGVTLVPLGVEKSVHPVGIEQARVPGFFLPGVADVDHGPDGVRVPECFVVVLEIINFICREIFSALNPFRMAFFLRFSIVGRS